MNGVLRKCVLCLAAMLLALHDSVLAQDPLAKQTVRPGLQAYVNARTVIDLTPPELVKAFPELKGLDFALGQDELASLLQEVGKGVEIMFQDFPNTGCVEQVRQRIKEPRGIDRSEERRVGKECRL